MNTNEQQTLDIAKKPISNNYSNDTEPKEELIQKKEIENTPFTIVTTDGKSFGTLGMYKITEDRETPEDVEKELTEISWNRITQIVLLLNKILKSEEI